jgi:hypothetical protein
MRFPVSLLAAALLVLWLSSPLRADRGVVDDPDGFTNLRAAPSAASAVVARVKVGEVFEFSAKGAEGSVPGHAPRWVKVTLRNGQVGWIDYSRIGLHFEPSELRESGFGDEVNHDKGKGFDYYPTARRAAQGDLQALRTFFDYRPDGAAGEAHDFVALVVFHLAGDNAMAAFISRQAAARRHDLREFLLALPWTFPPQEYLRVHFPKTAAALGLQR